MLRNTAGLKKNGQQYTHQPEDRYLVKMENPQRSILFIGSKLIASLA